MRWVFESLKGAWLLEFHGDHSDYNVSFWVLLIDSVDHRARQPRVIGREAYIAPWLNGAREANDSHTYDIGPESPFVPRGAP